MKEIDIREFRDGIFSLRTRRFGKVAEILIKKLVKAVGPQNQFHDLYDPRSSNRIEVKFCTVQKKNESSITDDNVIDAILEANSANRQVLSTEWQEHDFDCNIQQVKPDEFDVLYYGVFFADRIAIFSMEKHEVESLHHYSDKQHKGNVGEGQFHLNRGTFAYHLKHHFRKWLTYEELLHIIMPDSEKYRLVNSM